MKTHEYRKWLSDEYVPIAGGALESNIIGIWFAKQGKKGEFVANEKKAWTKRGRWVGGDLQVTRTDGEEAWSDQTLFSDHVDFVNTFIGNGAPVVQGQSSLIAYLCWLAMGQETFTKGENAELVLEAASAPTGEGTLSLKVGVNTYTTAKLKVTATGTEVLAAMALAFPVQWSTANVECVNPTIKLSEIKTTPLKFKFKEELGFQPVPEASLTSAEFGGGEPTWKVAVAGKLHKHVTTPSSSGGFYFGIAKEVGKSTVYRAQFNDCRAQSLRVEGSSASKVVKITPTVLSLNPGEIMGEAPEKTDDGITPFIFTEAAGTLQIDGTSYHGQSGFAVMFTWGLNEYYGDQVHPFDVINNVATASIEGVTLLIDQAGLERYNSQIYGTTTPASGTKPLEVLPLMGSYKVIFSRKSLYTNGVSESLTVEMFGVKWSPTLAIPANPAGGAVELSFTGQMRKTPGGIYAKETKSEAEAHGPFRVTVENYLDKAAFTV